MPIMIRYVMDAHAVSTLKIVYYCLTQFFSAIPQPQYRTDNALKQGTSLSHRPLDDFNGIYDKSLSNQM